jgi:hypothetical protein
MNVIGLDNREYVWNLKSRKRTNVSKGHARARDLLHIMFPCEIIVEEITLPGSRMNGGNNLIADFVLPKRNLLIEVQGEQHYIYNNHFYNNKLEFARAKARDKNKQRWCEVNDIILIQLPDKETDNEWKTRISSRFD